MKTDMEYKLDMQYSLGLIEEGCKYDSTCGYKPSTKRRLIKIDNEMICEYCFVGYKHKEIKDYFYKKAWNLSINYYRTCFFNPDDEFCFDITKNMSDELDCMTEYDEIRGTTRLFTQTYDKIKNIVLFHFGNGEYGIYQMSINNDNKIECKNIEVWSINKSTRSIFIEYWNELGVDY